MFVILFSGNHGLLEKCRRRISLCCLSIETLFMAVRLLTSGCVQRGYYVRQAGNPRVKLKQRVLLVAADSVGGSSPREL